MKISKFRMLLVSVIAGAFLIRLAWPTKIIAMHKDSNGYSFDIIIKHPPITEQGKIEWWIDHKNFFREKYNVPVGKKDYSISFWVSDYKVMPDTDQGSDLLCFEDMDPPANCIEKNNPLTVSYRHDTHQMIISLNNGQTHWLRNDLTGRMRKVDI